MKYICPDWRTGEKGFLKIHLELYEETSTANDADVWVANFFIVMFIGVVTLSS